MSKKLNYDEMYTRYKNLVYQTAYKYSKNVHTAEDIMQETFLTLYVSIDTMNQSNIISWLITTAKNAALNDRKKQRKQIPSNEIKEESSEQLQVPDTEIFYLNREATAERLCLTAQIFDAMLEKNPRWHQAMTMVCKMEIPRAIVAEEMGVSLKVLDSLLHRARMWVRKEYGVTLKETRQN